MGNPVPLEEYVIILEGLTTRVCISHFYYWKLVWYSLVAKEEALLAHDSCALWFKKRSSLLSSLDLGICTIYSYSPGSSPNNDYASASNSPGSEHFANFQCQICLKYGHNANICFYKADASSVINHMSLFFSMILSNCNLSRNLLKNRTLTHNQWHTQEKE